LDTDADKIIKTEKKTNIALCGYNKRVERLVSFPSRTMVMYMMMKTTDREVGISYSGSVLLKMEVT
jgi:hypothetical protein